MNYFQTAQYRKIIFIFFTIFLIACSEKGYVDKALDTLQPNFQACGVMRVLEGNLFYCETPNLQVLKVKLMGVAIDEYKKQEAKEFTKSLLKYRSNVWISLDDNVREHSGVLSAFVYLQDKTFLNGYLIRQGIGFESFEGREVKFKKRFEDIYYKELSDTKDVEEEIQIENSEKAPWLN